MAGDSKTEKATPKKRRDERKKGNIFQSKDILNAASLLGVFLALGALLPMMTSNMKNIMVQYIGMTSSITDISNALSFEIGLDALTNFAIIGAPILIISILITVIVSVFQTRLLFSTDSLKVKFSRLNPLQGIKKMFALKSFVEVLKGIIKIAIIVAVIYNFFTGLLVDFAKTLYLDINSSIFFVLNSVRSLILNVGVAFAAIAILDYFYQWWDYERQIKMSKHDIKQEFKQMEGDPQIKGKIRELQRQRAMSRMMQKVPEADVVIRNPNHFAVALKYDINSESAPYVIAKGQDELALRIIELATKNSIHCIENVPLARALYASTEIGMEIPMEYYGEVAEVLAYIYKLDNKILNK